MELVIHIVKRSKHILRRRQWQSQWCGSTSNECCGGARYVCTMNNFASFFFFCPPETRDIWSAAVRFLCCFFPASHYSPVPTEIYCLNFDMCVCVRNCRQSPRVRCCKFIRSSQTHDFVFICERLPHSAHYICRYFTAATTTCAYK